MNIIPETTLPLFMAGLFLLTLIQACLSHFFPSIGQPTAPTYRAWPKRVKRYPYATVQVRLTDFFPNIFPPGTPVGKRRTKPRSRKPPSTPGLLQTTFFKFDPFLPKPLRPIPEIYPKDIKTPCGPPSQQGTAAQLFEATDFCFWHDLHNMLYPSKRGPKPYPIPAVIKGLILAAKWGHHTLQGVSDFLRDNRWAARLCGFSKGKTPTRSALSKIFTKIGPGVIHAFFVIVRNASYADGVFTLRILAKDTSLLGSNCSGRRMCRPLDEKEEERVPFDIPEGAEVARVDTYSDPDADWCIRHGKVKGVGLNHATIVDALEELPVEYKVFPGGLHDSHTLMPVTEQYLSTTPVRPSGMVMDNGYASKSNRRYIKKRGIPAVIAARENQKNVVRVPTGQYFRRADLKKFGKEDLAFLARVRPSVEREYSVDKGHLGERRMPFRGIERGESYVGIRHVGRLMTARAAVLFGMPYLKRSAKAFRSRE